MKKNLAIFWLFTKYSLKRTLVNKIGVILFTFGKLLRFGMFFLFVYFLLSNTKLLAGYSFDQTIVFYLSYNIIDSITQLMFREVYRFRQLVVSGELDTILVKPYHPFLRVLVGGVDILDAFMVVLYTCILVFFIGRLGHLSFSGVLLYISMIVNSFLIATSFHILVLAVGILSTEVDHAIMIYRDISRLGSFPVDIYAQPVRFILTFIVPIGVMMTFPVQSLISLLSPLMYGASFAIGISSILFSLKMWDIALKKYQSWGG